MIEKYNEGRVGGDFYLEEGRERERGPCRANSRWRDVESIARCRPTYRYNWKNSYYSPVPHTARTVLQSLWSVGDHETSPPPLDVQPMQSSAASFFLPERVFVYMRVSAAGGAFILAFFFFFFPTVLLVNDCLVDYRWASLHFSPYRDRDRDLQIEEGEW